MSELNVVRILVCNIKVGQRIRQDLGDLNALAESIRSAGELLHPLVLNSRHELVVGGRRLEAVKLLEWEYVPCHICETFDDTRAAVRAEVDENVHRKDFSLIEKLAAVDLLWEFGKAAAKERQREGGRAGGKASGKLPEASIGQTRDRIAEVVGWSGKTLEYAMKVRDHGDPELLEAADKNVLSVSMAVKLVGLPKSQQREIVRAEDPYSAAKDAISRLVPITGIRQEGGGESRTPIAIQVVTEGGPNQTRPVLCSVTTEPLSEQHTAPVRQATAVARAASAPAALVCPSSTELNFAIASVGDIQADLKRIRRMRTSEKRVAYMENVIVHLRSIASHLEQEMRATASK